MGWASGSELMSEVISALQGEATDEGRKRVYEHMIPAFSGMDCDTLDECRGEDPMYDEALDEWQKRWDEE